MKTQFVKDIKVGDAVKAPFLVRKLSFDVASNEAKYARMTLRDMSGDVEAKWFGISDAQAEMIQENNFIMVYGKSDQRRNDIQIKINHAEPYVPKPEDLVKFEPQSFLPLDLLQEKLDNYIKSIKHSALQELLNCFFVYDANLRKDFEEFPASISNHHGFKHGLLQHSLEVASIVDFDVNTIVSWGKIQLSRDLLITGALLHDIGKLREYQRVGSSDFTWNEMGQLLGHIVLGIEMITEKIRQLDDFPKELEFAIKHIVASHHGKKEYGSPVTPYFYEAQLIADADNKSASAQHWIDALNTEYADSQPFQLAQKLGGDFKVFPRRVYVGDNIYKPLRND